MITFSKLHGSLLGQSDQKVGKVISGARYGVPAAVELRGIETGKNKRAPRITVRFRIHLHTPEISAPAPGVLAVIPDYVVGEGIGLASVKLRSRVLQAAEICE